MRVTIECGNCGKLIDADVIGIIETLIACAKHNSIYGGFLCEGCGEQLDEEF